MVDHFIHGIDEAGRIGNIIFFSEVSIPTYNETYLMIKNLDTFNKLILNKYDIHGFDAKSLLTFARDSFDDPIIEVRNYSLNQTIQNKLLALKFKFLSQRLFRTRGELINFFSDNDRSHIQRTLNILNAFKRKTIYAESFVKSIGFQKIAEKIGTIYLKRYGESLISEEGPNFYINIDGGFPFSYWWYDLLSKDNNGLNLGKSLILGITNADNHYPAVSLSGTLANIIEKFPDKRFYFPISPLEFQIDEQEIYQHDLDHHKSLSRPFYQNRLLMLGDLSEETRQLMPYICHLESSRNKTYEPFNINTGVENFMKDFGYGEPSNTLILKGSISTVEEKESISFCNDRGYDIKECIDFQDQIDDLFQMLSEEIDLGSSRKRSSLHGKLARIKSSCENDLQ